jgi:hypothetical protein
MNQQTCEGNWCQGHLADRNLWRLLEKVDGDLLQVALAAGCLLCGGKLHRADYPRKPRGGPDWDSRFSLCCAEDGCRARHTPPSVRFLGRRIYAGFVVVLVSTMVHGLKPEWVQRIREQLGIDQRTLERWRRWWLSTFAQSAFWKAAKGRFMPPLDEQTLPWPLALAFGSARVEGLRCLLEFLAPLTTHANAADRAM